ncbi:SIS domain-containing protein [Halomonas sp. MG34]|nr:SIS domain-containing protein [Halomonas sp. MG34]
MAHVKGGLVILKEMVNSLSPSERKVATYIIDHPQEAIHLTALGLGEKSNTSSAAVIRLCKSLGVKGFQELKIRVAGDLQTDDATVYRDIEPNETYKSIIDKVTANTVQTLKETVDIIDENQLEKAVEALANANSIVLAGVGASYIAAKDGEQKFQRIDKNAYSFSDIHLAATLIANKGKGDVVIGISFSGDTQEVAKLLQLAKQRDITTIGITKYGNSLVSQYADILLHTSAAKEATFRSGATSSRIAQLHVVDMVLMCLASNHYEETIQHLDASREAVMFLRD